MNDDSQLHPPHPIDGNTPCSPDRLTAQAVSPREKDLAQSSATLPPAPPFTQPLVTLIPANEVEPKPISWLWRHYIPRGGITIIAGKPGTGKTTITLDLAASVSRGRQLPDGVQADIGTVYIWSSEDTLAEVLRPRLEAADADLTKIKFIGQTATASGSARFNPATDIPKLLTSIPKGELPSLVIIDPMIAAVKGDSHKNNETRNSLQPLVDFAEATGCAVVGITHLTKGTLGKDPLERINGSIAFGALARSVLITAAGPKLDGAKNSTILVRTKSNYGVTGGGFYYEIEEAQVGKGRAITASKVIWKNSVQGDAQGLIATVEGDGRPAILGAREEARNFLSEELKNGSVPQSDLEKKANKLGISTSTLNRAKGELSIVAKKIDKAWQWSLPPSPKNNVTPHV